MEQVTITTLEKVTTCCSAILQHRLMLYKNEFLYLNIEDLISSFSFGNLEYRISLNGLESFHRMGN